MVAYAFSLSTQEIGRAWSTERTLGWPGPGREVLSQKKNKPKNAEHVWYMSGTPAPGQMEIGSSQEPNVQCLAEKAHIIFSERACFEKIRWRDSVEDTPHQPLVSTPGTPIHTGMRMRVHTHTHPFEH